MTSRETLLNGFRHTPGATSIAYRKQCAVMAHKMDNKPSHAPMLTRSNPDGSVRVVQRGETLATLDTMREALDWITENS